jgi:RNA polymerase sigma-70 factor (ECF subfamily)
LALFSTNELDLKDLFIIGGLEMRNPELFNELFKQYSKPLFYYAAKFVEDEAARDIVQDVFEKLWSDQKITVKQSLNSLLFAMVRNSCLQNLEKQKVRNKYIESNKLKLQEDELQFYMNERTSLIEQELENKLHEVLNHLPERCKQIFLMSRFEHKKNREIAEELDISVKAVEKQISKALISIRFEMKDYLPLLMFFSTHIFKS